MPKTVQAYECLNANRKQFERELKIYVNEKLFQKKIISEDMYYNAKEILLKDLVE